MSLVIALVIIGVVLYLVSTYIPMDPAILVILRIVAIVVALLLVAQHFGVPLWPARVL